MINYSSINFYTLYYENENYADFDGLQLYKEEFGPSYTYDPKGNIVSTSDLAKQQSTFEYDANNNLVKSINPKGNSFNYTYDAKHNVQTATSAENVKSTFTYDAAGNPLTAKVDCVNDASTFIQAQSTYSTSGNYMKTVEDSVGNTVNYDYDETKGTLNSVTDPKGKATSYLYDNLDRLQSVSKTADALAVTNSYSYANDKIESITHNGFNYNFGYDPLGNNTTVDVGTKNLITNNYEARTGKLLGSTYGNNQTAALAYDSEDRVISRMYGGIEKFTYSYDASGNVASHDDKVNGSNYKYVYDASERLVNIIEKLTASPSVRNVMNYDYDIESNLKTFRENVNGIGHMNSYEYDKDSKITDIFYNNPYKNDGNVENFPLNGTTTGTLGTKPYSESATFGKDSIGKTVLVPNSTTKILYDLGLKIDEGTLGTWFNTAGLASTRYLIASEGKNGSALHMYLKADNTLALAVRKSIDGSWNELKISTVAASSKVWHYGSFNWKLNGSILNYSLNLDGQNYTDAVAMSTVKDFSGAITAVGGHNSGAYQLNGNLEQFSYYAKALTGAEITDIYNKGRGNGVKYLYDSIGRLKDRTISTGTLNNAGLKTSYEYQAGNVVIGANTSTSTQVKSIDNGGKKIDYTYDKNGNIATIIENSKEVGYYYNELNELTREDSQVLDKTIGYSYDVGGNIKTKTEYPYTKGTLGTATKTSTYAYDDTNWKDKLTAFNDGTASKSITYDEIGNPLSYNGDTYTWEQGRQLAGKTGNGKDVTFKYNDSGIRTQKTVNGVTTTYHLVGDKVTYEENDTDKIYYTYDSSDNLVSMNLNNEEYYYIRNAQGDIIGLNDKGGTQVVTYVYDAWGKLISTTGTLATTLGVKNPYLYRGYRYDTETGLYYLQSRYYNPDWGRFINADAEGGKTGTLLSHNVFAYCLNNPVNMQDEDGNFPSWNDIKKWASNAVSTAKQVLSVVLYIHPGVFVVQDSFPDPYEGNPKAAKAANEAFKLSVFGAKGIQTPSLSVWKKGKTERIDIENPAPGKRAGDIHYHEPNNKKWRFDVNDGLFLDPKSLELAPPKIQNLLDKREIQGGLEKGLKFLGETIKLFK